MKKQISPTEYLQKVLKWKRFVEQHEPLAQAIKDVLLELYYLRERVAEQEVGR